MADNMLLCLLVGIFVSGASGKYCDGLYCPGDCCGSSYNRYCCNDIANSITGGAIVGIIVGCLFLVSIVVSVIVCIICCLRKSRASTGHVVGQGGATATVLTSSTPYPTGYPQPSHYPAQPPYNTGQPAYNSGQPAYNPGQPAYNPSQPAYNPGQAAHNGGKPAYNQTPVYPTSPADQPPPYHSLAQSEPGV